MSEARVRKILKLVDQLELDAEEFHSLRVELEGRGECLVDLDACATDAERQLALLIKDRIDAAARGEVKMISATEASRILRERRRARGRPSAG